MRSLVRLAYPVYYGGPHVLIVFLNILPANARKLLVRNYNWFALCVVFELYQIWYEIHTFVFTVYVGFSQIGSHICKDGCLYMHGRVLILHGWVPGRNLTGECTLLFNTRQIKWSRFVCRRVTIAY